MDYRALRAELVTFLRGDKSRNSINEELNFTYDKVARWEQVDSTLDWDDFIRLLNLLDIPVTKALIYSFIYHGDPLDGQAIVRSLTKGMKVEDISHITGLTIHRIRRIQSDFTPKVSEMFLLLDKLVMRNNLISFFTNIGVPTLPTLQKEIELGQRFYQLFREDRYYYFLINFITLDSLKGDRKKIVDLSKERLGISDLKLDLMLSRLVELEIITDDAGVIQVTNRFGGQKQEKEDYLSAAQFYSNLYNDHLHLDGKKKGQVLMGYYSGMISQKAYDAVQEETRRFLTNIYRIMNDTEGDKERFVAMSMGFFDPSNVARNHFAD